MYPLLSKPDGLKFRGTTVPGRDSVTTTTLSDMYHTSSFSTDMVVTPAAPDHLYVPSTHRAIIFIIITRGLGALPRDDDDDDAQVSGD